MIKRFAFGRRAQALGGKAAECLTNSDGPNAIILFGKGHQGCTCQERSYFWRRLSTCQKTYH